MTPLDTPISAEQRYAYVLFRLLTGFCFFGHGFPRIFYYGGLSAFAVSMQTSMAKSPLPSSLTLATGYVVPCVEAIIGCLLIVGLATRWALAAAFVLMMVLTFGSAMNEHFDAVNTQLLFGPVLAALLLFREKYDLSWPGVLRMVRTA